jgi:hypothetical protein
MGIRIESQSLFFRYATPSATQRGVKTKQAKLCHFMESMHNISVGYRIKITTSIVFLVPLAR